MYCVEIVKQQPLYQDTPYSLPPSLPVYDSTSQQYGQQQHGQGQQMMMVVEETDDLMLFDDIMNFSASTDNLGLHFAPQQQQQTPSTQQHLPPSYLSVNGVTVQGSAAASSASGDSESGKSSARNSNTFQRMPAVNSYDSQDNTTQGDFLSSLLCTGGVSAAHPQQGSGGNNPTCNTVFCGTGGVV